mgnify:CR=1 FL=1
MPLEEVEDEQKQGKATNKIRSITMASKDLGKRESYARCASTFLQTKITNNLLYKKGLPSMVVQYQLKHISI